MRFLLSKIDNYVARFVVVLIAMFPILLGTVEHASSIVFTLLVLVALPNARKTWKTLDLEERRVFYAFIIFLAASVLSFINVEDWGQTFKRLERLVRFAFVIPIYLYLRHANTNIFAPFSWGIAFSGPVMLGMALYKVYWMGDERASGAYHSVLYGDFTMLSASIGFALLIANHISSWLRASLIIGIFTALYASVLTGTRSAWMALPPVLLLIGWNYWTLKTDTRMKVKALAAITLIIIVSTLLAVNSKYVTQRINVAASDIGHYIDGRNKDTSIGRRFMLWENAARIWLRHPILGTGLGDFKNDNREMIKKGETELTVKYTGAHSIYMEYLATTGLIGLIAMMTAIIFVPIRFFWMNLNSTEDSSIRALSLAGIIIAMNYSIYGFAQTWIASSPAVNGYLIMLVIIMSILKSRGYERES